MIAASMFTGWERAIGYVAFGGGVVIVILQWIAVVAVSREKLRGWGFMLAGVIGSSVTHLSQIIQITLITGKGLEFYVITSLIWLVSGASFAVGLLLVCLGYVETLKRARQLEAVHASISAGGNDPGR